MEPQPFPNQSNQPARPEQPHLSNPLSVMQPGEQIICEIKRHPIGMLGVYAASGGILLVLAVLAFIVLPNAVSTDSRTQALAGAGLAFIVIAAVVLAFVFIANKVYWGNHWVVTSDSITQMTQTSLFSKQSAQLSLGNLEDITAEQNGILAQLFKFGVLKAETAGERSKFLFLYCPNPNYYAEKILAAREVFEQVHHGGKQEPYVAPVAVPQYSSTPAPANSPSSEPPAETNAEYQVGQRPPNFATPPLPLPTYPDQPPAGPSAQYPPTTDYQGEPDPGVNINTNLG